MRSLIKSPGLVSRLMAISLVTLVCCSGPRTEETRWPNGSVKEQFTVTKLESGGVVRDGPYRSWNEAGQLTAEGTYRDGLRDGLWTLWRGTVPNVRRWEGEYVLDKKNGEWRAWMNPEHDHRRHQTGAEDHQHNTGDSPGDEEATWQHPRHHKIESYQNGAPHGPFLSWHPDGHIADSVHYQDGKLHGKIISYHWNGRVATRAEFKNGVLQGKQVIWDEEGNISAVID